MANTLENSFPALSILCPHPQRPPVLGFLSRKDGKTHDVLFRAWLVSLSTSRSTRSWRGSPAYVSHGLSIRLSVGIWVVSQVHLSGTFLDKSSCGHVLSFLWNKYLGLALLGHVVSVQSTPEETAPRFPRWPWHPALGPEWVRVPAAPRGCRCSDSWVRSSRPSMPVVGPAHTRALAFPSPWASHPLMPSHAYWVGQGLPLQNVTAFGKRVFADACKSRPPWMREGL